MSYLKNKFMVVLFIVNYNTLTIVYNDAKTYVFIEYYLQIKLIFILLQILFNYN